MRSVLPTSIRLRQFSVCGGIILLGIGAASADSLEVRAEDAPIRTAIEMLPTLESDPDSALAAALERIEGEPLTLEEAIESTLENAVLVRDAEAALAEERGSLRSVRGGFDPELFAELTRTSDDRQTTSPFSGADVLESESTRRSAGARVTLPIGTELSASIDATRSESNSTFATLDPQFDAEGRLTVRQPLLRGFGPAAWAPLSSAKRSVEAAAARYEDARAAARAMVESRYWDLYASEQDLAVQLLLVEQARLLLQETQLRAKAGLVGPNQVANARVFLAEQEQEVLDREEELDLVSDQLVTLIGRRPSGVRFRSAQGPAQTFPDVSEAALLERATRESRLLRAAERDVEAARARERGARWDALPALDLVGSIGGSGVSGLPHDVIFGGDTLRATVDGTLGDAVGDAVKRDSPSWSAGLRLSVPIGLRAGRGERDRARGERMRAEESLRAAHQRLEEDVRAAYRELAHGRRRLDAAKEGIDASFEQVRIGLIEYHNGRTTAFEVVRLASDLAVAQQRYSSALVRVARAGSDLRRLTFEQP